MIFRHDQFRRLFNPQEFRQFRSYYEGINPDRPVETDSMRYEDTESLFQALVSDSEESEAFVSEFLPQLGLFLQGPFPLPGRRITRSAWDCRGKSYAYSLCKLNSDRLQGKRTLDIGSNAGYDPFYMHALGAAESVGMEPNPFYWHAMFLNAVYNRPAVTFINAGWEQLDRSYLGDFDIVSCLGLIYHLREPMQLLEKIASIMRPGSDLIMETHVLSEPSRQAYFVEDNFWGDESYWWIFGDDCLMSMLRSSGFRDVKMVLKADCDSRNPNNPRITVEGHPAGARAWFVATRGRLHSANFVSEGGQVDAQVKNDELLRQEELAAPQARRLTRDAESANVPQAERAALETELVAVRAANVWLTEQRDAWEKLAKDKSGEILSFEKKIARFSNKVAQLSRTLVARILKRLLRRD